MPTRSNGLLRWIERRHKFHLLEPHLTFNRWERNARLYELGKPQLSYDFLGQGIVSVTRPGIRNGEVKEYEISTYGGQVGVMLGGNTLFHKPVAVGNYVARLDGCGWRITREALWSAMEEDRELREMFQSAVFVMLNAINQLVICRTVHSTTERLARLLLILHAAVRSDRIDQLTRETIADMVPCARGRFYDAAAPLLEAGVITMPKHRGYIEIVDAEALGRFACECYQSLVDARRAMVEEER